MTYQQYGRIDASDYNGFVGANPTSVANTLNAVLAIGNGRSGLGQTAVSQVPTPVNTSPTVVTNEQWNLLINNIQNLASHQGSTITPVSVTADGQLISAYMTGAIPATSIFSNNLNTLFTNRNNAAAQGSSSTDIREYTLSWNNVITFTHTISFESGDKARYFFNAGGQIALSFSHPPGTNMNNLWNTLAAACGTITLSAVNSGTQTIAGTVFNGVTRTGGTGTPATLATNNGYYALNNTNTPIFKMLATSGPAGYLSSFIQVSAKTNSTQGLNGDAGSIITLTTVWDSSPNNTGNTSLGKSGPNSTVTCVVRSPSSSYLSPSWGGFSVTSSVTGS
jgi:hypothetical protein